MACLSKRGPFFFLVLALVVLPIMAGCVTLRVIKVNDGKIMSPAAEEFTSGKATLDAVLAKYGAPADVVDLEGRTALVYHRAYYRANQISFGIPFSNMSGVSASLSAYGNLLQYDSLIFFVNPDGTVSHTAFEKGTTKPYFSGLFED
jgi:hypothetical protein